MRLNAFGKWLEVMREDGVWIVYELGDGKKVQTKDFYIPSDYNQTQVIQYLEDMLHERATPENPRIRKLD
jgi:hypothetical protein